MTLHVKHFDTDSSEGFRAAVEFEKNNPDYKLINSRLDSTWYFEKLITDE